MAESESGAVQVSPSRTFESFLNLEVGRQFGLMLGLAASVTLGVALAMWLVTEKDYKPLYDTLDRLDASTVVQILESNQIDYRIDQRSGALLIDSSRFHEARIALSAAGLPLDKNQGFELLDQEQPLGTSQFMESARYRRGLEGELARTISNISSVKAARVHLAVPKSTVFLRDAKDTRASVFVQAYGGMPLDKTQVRAIANLVASSVPELRIENVTVVDQRGNLLSDFDDDPEFVEAARQLDYQRQLEKDLLERVNSLLEPILGAENYRAEVSAELDFTRIEQAAETYNPDYPAVRSEQTSEEGQNSEDVGGIPGVNSNLPGGEAAEPDDGQMATTKRFETRNYELDRTISYTQRATGTIKRLSVAVAVADKQQAETAVAGSENATSGNWQSEELARLESLVQNAVGYDLERGDSVTVVNTPFFRDVPEPIEAYTPQLWEQPWFWQVVRGSLGALAFLLVIFMVLRPAMKRLTDNSARIKELEVKHQQALEAVNEVAAGGEAKIDPDGTVHLTGAAENLLPSPQDALDDQINLVKNMIDEDPDRVAQVIQGWTKSDE